MVKEFLKYSLAFALIVSMVLVACDSGNEEIVPEDDTLNTFVDESLYSLQGEGDIGRFGCYELVFPITLEFEDGTTISGETYEELVAAIREWKEANPDVRAYPSFVFPIEVISEEGEVISVASKEELRALKRACRRNYFDNHGPRGHGRNCMPCFSIVFPVTIAFPGGTTAEAASRAELKSLVRDWKAVNPDAEERPALVFPIEVELEDGTLVPVGSKEELEALRESCS